MVSAIIFRNIVVFVYLCKDVFACAFFLYFNFNFIHIFRKKIFISICLDVSVCLHIVNTYVKFRHFLVLLNKFWHVNKHRFVHVFGQIHKSLCNQMNVSMYFRLILLLHVYLPYIWRCVFLTMCVSMSERVPLLKQYAFLK